MATSGWYVSSQSLTPIGHNVHTLFGWHWPVWYTSHMPEETTRRVATSRDVHSPATGSDTDYTLSIEQAVERYAAAGHPRTTRSIQRYCASGHLDCVKETTTLGDKYFISAQSVARHIAQIEELISLDTRSTSRDMSRPDATPVAPKVSDDVPYETRQPVTPTSQPVAAGSPEEQRSSSSEEPRWNTTEPDKSRPVATEPTPMSPYVAQLESEIAHLKDDKEFLREQVKTKDVQIAALLERDRETNILVGSLQRMLAPLLGGPRYDRRDDAHDADGGMR